MHLYYNMASFAWKGIVLESVLGAPFFAYMLVVFSVLTGLLSVAIYYALAMVFTHEFMFSCGVGFSGVIFALKVIIIMLAFESISLSIHSQPELKLEHFPLQVVLNRVYPDVHPTIGGFQMRIPGGMYVWLELLLLSFISPGVSFVGHLSGILVGFAYSMGLLHPIFDAFGAIMGYSPHRQWGARTQRPSYNNYQRHQERPTFFQVPKPPSMVTCLVMVLLTGVYFKDRLPKYITKFYPYIAGNCINSYLILDANRYVALGTAALHTLNRLHLAYCLITLWKVGTNIERRLGSTSFAAVLALLTLGSGLVYVGLVRYVLVHTESVAGVYPYDMKYKCFMGPTALLLALKVIHSHLFPYSPSSVLLLDIPGVPLLVLLIAEIVVLHLAFPQAWIIGNVAGVLAGLLYVVLL